MHVLRVCEENDGTEGSPRVGIEGMVSPMESGHLGEAKAAGIRWWPAALILGLCGGAVGVVWMDPTRSHQQRNLTVLATVIIAAPLLLVWWGHLSGVSLRRRLAGVAGVFAGVGLFFGLFQISGVSGDLRPIFRFRWAGLTAGWMGGTEPRVVGPVAKAVVRADYPQFLGPQRDGVIRGVRLDPDWKTNGPVELWRRPVGAAWSGFVVVGDRAYTQEQDGAEEAVSAFDLATGRLVWAVRTPGRYATTIAGEGPRSTPLVVGGRVYALGATGTFQCLDVLDGRVVWRVSVRELAKCGVPEWGFASSPLWLDGRVAVLVGGEKAVWVFRPEDGSVVWSEGEGGANYGSLQVMELGGVRQLVYFAGRAVVGMDTGTGKELWRHPFGTGMPLVAAPVVLGTNRFVVSAGYGVGAEGVEWTEKGMRSLWVSKRLKAKFSNPVAFSGIVCGLDDGILAAIDGETGAGLWKEGRWGHGQGLRVGEHYLLMAESGELVLLRPDRQGPGELGRMRVFDAKTWNPIALAGDRLLVRNDREAVCLKLGILEGN